MSSSCGGGYAMISMESLGAAGSTGCPDAGGAHEAAATRAVIDWLGGSGRAYDSAGAVVAADWSARKVGMYGVSYGWQGEDADIHARIVLSRQNPEVCAAAMDELEREQDRATGDYSPFWAVRDYAAQASKIKASVFIVQGLRDWNVKTKQGIQLWEALGRHGVDRKLWLYDGDHGSASAPQFSRPCAGGSTTTSTAWTAASATRRR